MKGFDALNAAQKNLSSLQSTIPEEKKINRLKRLFLTILTIFDGTLQRAEVFCIAFSAPKHLI